MQAVESCLLNFIRLEGLSGSALLETLYELQQTENCLLLVGCKEQGHREMFTGRLIQFYIILRFYFICKAENQSDLDRKKQLNKNAKFY